MAQQQIQEIEVPPLALRHSSVDEYCRAVQKARLNAFWFYQDISKFFGNYRKPFQDSEGRWWLRIRQGFAWPADLLSEFEPKVSPAFKYTFLAYQHIVPPGAPSNSKLAVNVLSLPDYGHASFNYKKRNKIRQGMKLCDIVLLEKPEKELIKGITEAWNSLVQRTGWKWPLNEQQITEKLGEQLDMPATSVLVAIEKASGRVSGFLITKIVGDTASVDTIASNSELLSSKPNDSLMYTFLMRSKQIPGVVKGNYSIRGTVTPLEEFKQALGFEPKIFPAMLHARPGFLSAVKMLRPTMYKRLVGEVYWEDKPEGAGEGKSEGEGGKSAPAKESVAAPKDGE